MKPLRPGSWRPELIVDDHAHRLADPNGNYIGIPGPLGRERCIAALPIGGSGPVQLAPHIVVRDDDTHDIADPLRNLIGNQQAVWVMRMLYARWTLDTRRLSG